MAQLQQWKANNETKIGPVNQSNFGLVKNPAKLKFEQTNGRKNSPVTKSKNGLCENPQSESYSEPKKKLSFNPLHAEYAQISRQFKLILDSNRKCREVYPDDFHHKLKMRDECSDLIERLKGGGKLLNSLAKSSDLDQEQTALLQAFNAGNGYLIRKFAEVVEQINGLNIERVEIEKLQGAGNE